MRCDFNVYSGNDCDTGVVYDPVFTGVFPFTSLDISLEQPVGDTFKRKLCLC